MRPVTTPEHAFSTGAYPPGSFKPMFLTAAPKSLEQMKINLHFLPQLSLRAEWRRAQ